MNSRNKGLKRGMGIAWGVITVSTTGILLIGAAAGTEGADNITDHATAQAQAFEAAGDPLTVERDDYTVVFPDGNWVVTEDKAQYEELLVKAEREFIEESMTDEEYDAYRESEEFPEELPTYTLPPCEQEDSDNCYWDAAVMGNGTGTDFISLHGTVYYPSK